jgi:hypothetical protein
MEHLFGVAEEQGATKAEIGAVEALVMNASAGRVRAQFRAARVGAKKARKKG